MDKSLEAKHREPTEVHVGQGRLSEILNGEPLQASQGNGQTARLIPKDTDLSYTNLRGVSLDQADLSELNLRGCDLRNANLNGADLARCDLAGANLSGASLRGARLYEANLRDADLTEADLRDLESPPQRTITGGLKLGGAVLTNSRLPQGLAYPATLKAAQEASRNSQITFLGMFGALSYCVLTVLTTTDDKLVPNSAVSQLPVIQAPVPIADFYILAPALLVFLYLYFQLTLDRLWQLLADLPSKFPDGSTLDTAVDPWFLNSTFIGGLARLKYLSKRPLTLTRAIVGYLAAWWSVPLVVGCLWLRYLRSHDWIGTGIQVLLLALAIATAALTQWLWRRTLAGEISDGPLFLAPFRAGRSKGFTFYTVLALLAVVLPAGISYAAIEGELGRHRYFAADFSAKDVSLRDAQLSNVRGARLQGHNLKHLRADDSFLAKADFQEGLLDWGSFLNADLRQAQFQKSSLANAILDRADLRGADFQGATLWKASLNRCRLGEANLSNADLREVGLTAADLRGARLGGADLLKATLIGANLTGAILRHADLSETRLESAVLDHAILAHAVLEGANLTEATLRCADLTAAQLGRSLSVDAEFQCAIWTDADLSGADLSGADLSGATGLTLEQVQKATTDEDTILPWGSAVPPDCTAVCSDREELRMQEKLSIP